MKKAELEQNISKRCVIERSAIAGLVGKEATIKGVVEDKNGIQYRVELDTPLPTIKDKVDFYPHWSLIKVLDVLVGERAKDFFDNAVVELSNNYKDKDKKYLKQKCGGYWTDEKGNLIAFDNYSGECFVEEFSSLEEAQKYAKGIEAVTKDGVRI